MWLLEAVVITWLGLPFGHTQEHKINLNEKMINLPQMGHDDVITRNKRNADIAVKK